MKITTSRSDLANAVGWVAKSLPTRPNIPMLAGIVLYAGTGSLSVSVYDYEVFTEFTMPAQVATPGSVIVSGRLLAQITKSLPDKPVDLAAVDERMELVCGASRFTLPTMPTEDYPTPPGMPPHAGTVDAATFATAVGQVAVAAGTDSTLPMMTGIRIEVTGGQMALMATDRYRLALRELNWTPAAAGVEAAMLVPARTLADTAKAFSVGGGEVTVARDENRAGFEVAGRRTIARLIDSGNYPPVRSLFPTDDQFTLTVATDTAPLAEVVKRVALVADRGTPVLLTARPDGVLIVEAGDGAGNAKASEDLPAEVNATGPVTIAFNPGYLLDGLASLGVPKAHLAIVEPSKPAVLRPLGEDGMVDPTYRYLIMPIRIPR